MRLAPTTDDDARRSPRDRRSNARPRARCSSSRPARARRARCRSSRRPSARSGRRWHNSLSARRRHDIPLGVVARADSVPFDACRAPSRMVLRASRRGLDPSDSNTHTRVRAPLRMIRASRHGLDPSEFEPSDPSAFGHGRDRRSIDTPISARAPRPRAARACPRPRRAARRARHARRPRRRRARSPQPAVRQMAHLFTGCPL